MTRKRELPKLKETTPITGATGYILLWLLGTACRHVRFFKNRARGDVVKRDREFMREKDRGQTTSFIRLFAERPLMSLLELTKLTLFASKIEVRARTFVVRV